MTRASRMHTVGYVLLVLLAISPCWCQVLPPTLTLNAHISTASQDAQPDSVQAPSPPSTDARTVDPLSQPLDLSTAPRLPVGTVTLLTLAMAAASGLGALPFFFVTSLSKLWTGLANAIACGFMLAASFDLLHEGEPYGPVLVTLGVVLGAVFIAHSHAFLEQYEDAEFESLKGAGARKTLLIIGVMAAHAFGEGCGVGVSFCGHKGWKQGLLVTIAIGVHNIPEGLAKATVLVAQGVSARKALWWSVLTCLPQPLVAVPSFLFVDAFRALLPTALGFACGCMVWIVASELLPDALEDAPPRHVATAVTLSAAALEGVRMGLNTLQQPDGSLRWPVNAPPSVLLPLLLLSVVAVAIAAAAGCSAASLPLQHAGMVSMLGGMLVGGGSPDVLHVLLRGPPSPLLTPVLCAAGAAGCVLAWRHRAHGMAAVMGVSRAAWLQGDGVSALPTWSKVPTSPRNGASHPANGNGVAHSEHHHASTAIQRHVSTTEHVLRDDHPRKPVDIPLAAVLPHHHTVPHPHPHPLLRSPHSTAVVLAAGLLALQAATDGLSLAAMVTGASVPRALLRHTWPLLWQAAVASCVAGALLEPRVKHTTRLAAMGGGAGLLAALSLVVGMAGVCCMDWSAAGVGSRLRWSAAATEAVVGGGMLMMGGGVLRALDAMQQHGQRRPTAWWAGLAVGVCARGAHAWLCR